MAAGGTAALPDRKSEAAAKAADQVGGSGHFPNRDRDRDHGPLAQNECRVISHEALLLHHRIAHSKQLFELCTWHRALFLVTLQRNTMPQDARKARKSGQRSDFTKSSKMFAKLQDQQVLHAAPTVLRAEAFKIRVRTALLRPLP